MRTGTGSPLFESIVANLSDGIYVIQDGRLIFVNERCGEVFGYASVNDLVGGEMFADVYPDPQSAELFRTLNEQVLAGAPARTAWGQPCAKLDGTPFWLEVEARRIEVGGKPAVFGTFHDRTDCKLLGEAMHASQESLRLLLDAMSGDAALFTRADEVEAAWALIDPILKTWEQHQTPPLAIYRPGSWGPHEADALLARDGRNWLQDETSTMLED